MAKVLNDTILFETYQKINITLWTVLSLLSPILGTILNSYTLFVLFYVKALRRAHYMLIAGVAVSDLLCNAIFIPIEVIQSYYRIHFFTFVGSDHFCVFEGCAFAICFSASIIGQMLIAVNRGLAVFTPVLFHRYMTIRVAMTVWSAAALGVPTFYYIAGYFGKWVDLVIDRKFGDCAEKDTFTLKLVRVTVNTYLPCFIGLLLYILIVLRIVSSRTKERRRNIAKRARGSLAMFVNMTIYACCVLPLWISFGSESYSSDMERSLWLKFIFRFSYMVNPVSDAKSMPFC